MAICPGGDDGCKRALLMTYLFGGAQAQSTSEYGAEEPREKRTYSCQGVWRLWPHAGWDAAAPVRNAPYYALTRGSVERAQNGTGSGTIAIWDEAADTTVLYAHSGQANVGEDEWVEPGQRLGVQGARGNVTGPHVHVEVRAKKRTSAACGAPVGEDDGGTRDPGDYRYEALRAAQPWLPLGALVQLENERVYRVHRLEGPIAVLRHIPSVEVFNAADCRFDQVRVLVGAAAGLYDFRIVQPYTQATEFSCAGET
ncbi:MAG: M23 family metallopeptidase [Acidobacteriia bacterium]|nr:M23 family metallopeptidase [Terriglobia bacterium]